MALFDWLFGPEAVEESRQGDVTVRVGRNITIVGTGEPIVMVGCECGKTLAATFHSSKAKSFSCPKCGCVYGRSGKRQAESLTSAPETQPASPPSEPERSKEAPQPKASLPRMPARFAALNSRCGIGSSELKSV
jgi:hypothetical protein